MIRWFVLFYTPIMGGFPMRQLVSNHEAVFYGKAFCGKGVLW